MDWSRGSGVGPAGRCVRCDAVRCATTELGMLKRTYMYASVLYISADLIDLVIYIGLFPKLAHIINPPT